MKSRFNKGNAKRGMLDILQVVWVILLKMGSISDDIEEYGRKKDMRLIISAVPSKTQ